MRLWVGVAVLAGLLAGLGGCGTNDAEKAPQTLGKASEGVNFGTVAQDTAATILWLSLVMPLRSYSRPIM